jgi:transcription-repair coupling factor (superfamily II helicase)
MICNFVSDPKSPFFQSPAFVKIVQFVQKGKNKGRMKEKNQKLTLTFSNIPNVETADYLLNEMLIEISG